MKNSILKRTAGTLLALALTAVLLAGCSSGGENSSKGESSSPSEVSQAASGVSGGSEVNGYSYSTGLTDDGLFEGITALDFVTLPDYRGEKLPEGTTDISEEALQAELDSMMDSYKTTEQVTDRAVEDGDTVNIDYVGSVDGVEFEGGNTNGSGTTVTIGVTSYIDDFLEQLIGHKPGDSFDVNVTFPTPYENNPDLSGKDAVFKTTVNYIEEETLPELTDAFVAEHWKDPRGWTTVDQMKEGVRERLEREAAGKYMWGLIQDRAQVKEVPEAIRNYHLENMKNYYTAMAAQYGMEMEDFLSQAMGVENMDALVEQQQSTLDENARNSLLLQALAEDMGFSVTQERLDEYMKTEMNMEDYSDLEEFYGKPYLFLIIRESLVKEELGAMKLEK